MVLWGKMIFSRPSGVEEKIEEDLNMVGNANTRKIMDVPLTKLEGKKMDGVDRIKELKLLEEKQYIPVKK